MEANKNRDVNNVFQVEEDEPNEPFHAHNKFDPSKWSIKKPKSKRDLLNPSGAVEVFNITSGIKEKREQNREIVDIPLLQEKPKTVWDAIGLMKTIRQSFFDNFFTPIFGRCYK